MAHTEVAMTTPVITLTALDVAWNDILGLHPRSHRIVNTKLSYASVEHVIAGRLAYVKDDKNNIIHVYNAGLTKYIYSISVSCEPITIDELLKGE